MEVPISFQRVRQLVAVGALALIAGCSGAATPTCVDHDLPGFTVCTPSSWTITKGGQDSAAGRFASDNLVVIYDYGLYSDPLPLPEGASSATVAQVTVNGRPARQVRYTLQRASMPPMHYVGIHVPGLGTTSMGTLKLTLRAESNDAARLAEATAAFATIRFKETNKR